MTAFNLCDSWFVENHDLDNREPYVNTRETLACYHDACVGNQLTLGCNISTTVSSKAVYNGIDETAITVTVDVSNPDNIEHLIYDLAYSLSDGTSGSGITSGVFIITLPGDVTNSGLVLNVYGTIAATDTIVPGEIAQTYCTCNVAYSVQLGDGTEVAQYCDWSKETVSVAAGPYTDAGITYDLGGATKNYLFVNNALDISDDLDHAAIEQEIEDIFPGCLASIIKPAGWPLEVDVLIEHVLGEVTNVNLTFDSINVLELLDSSCA